MPATFYATAGESSTPETSFNPSLCAKNKLNLLPEHIAEISLAFSQQLPLALLSSRDFRILITIFNQTIGYNKREDDMNGACLERLTFIRSDHANKSVRHLEALNIIITSKGHYGKWMSINFDFLNWGKPRSDATTNDPRCLLSEIYQTPFEEDFSEFKLYVRPENNKKEAAVVSKEEQKTLAILPSEPLQTSELLEDSKPSEALKPLDISKPLETPQQPQDPVKPAFTAPFDAKVASSKLNFPSVISEKLRQLIIAHLGDLNLSKKTQQLLDYFVQCLRNGKVRNPIAYFIDLKERWLNGTLELNQTESQQEYGTETEKEARRQQIQNHINYQEAVADIEQIKRLIKTIRNQTQSTFEEALKKINYTQIWENAVECLEQTRKACYP